MRVPTSRRHRHLVVALYLNAALLACLGVAVLSRGGGGSVAMAAPSMPPIGGGGGVYMMPGQFSQYNWGVYLMDIDKQTLAAYEYIQGTKELKLVAARHFRHDRDLRNFNTSPSPEDVEKIVQLGKAGVRGQERRPEEINPNGQPPADPNGPARPGELNLPPASNPAGYVPKASEINAPG